MRAKRNCNNNWNTQTDGISQGVAVTTYVYDAANQLVRENVFISLNNENNKTVTYEYDQWGNLVNKYTYAYTTGSLGGGSSSAPNPLTSPTPTSGINVYLTDENGSPLAGGVFGIYYTQGTSAYSLEDTITTNSYGYAYYYPQMSNLYIKQESAPSGYAITDSAYHAIGSSGTQVFNYYNTGVHTPTQRIQYVYGNSSWQDQLTQIKTYTVSAAGVQTLTSTQSLSYDEMGNATSYLGKTLSWEGKRLTNSTSSGQNIYYAYDESGLRTQKTVNGITTNYYYNGSVLIGMTAGSIYQRFSYDSSGRLVAVDYSTNSGSSYTTYYYLRNGQGDIVKLLDGSGNTVVQYAYDTWGKQLSCTGTLATSLGQNQPFRYRGYVFDTETGWYYLQSRYYNPETCRFISSDVLLSTGQGVLGHNSYAYCLNNPVNMSDEGGCRPSFDKGDKGYTDGGDELRYIYAYSFAYSNAKYVDDGLLLSYIDGHLDIKFYVTFYGGGPYQGLIISGIEDGWSGVYNLAGYEISVTTTVICGTAPNGTSFPIYTDCTLGVSGSMYIYIGDSRTGTVYDDKDIEWISEHEFGHRLGLHDAYSSESWKGLSVMNGFHTDVQTIDVYKVLQFFVTGQSQYYGR
ncbi:MAG: hypothetical protein PHT58_00755 [Eubacteriales bacterium]|nr:hypothetical protein [Eubacteriales bacterium]